SGRRPRGPSRSVRGGDAGQPRGGRTGDPDTHHRRLARKRARLVNHADHVALLAPGVMQGEGGIWADLGAGTGAFTLALADLIGPHGVIHAIDRDRAALAELRGAFVSAVPQAELHVHAGDFTRRLELADLDGVVMANSLHF